MSLSPGRPDAAARRSPWGQRWRVLSRVSPCVLLRVLGFLLAFWLLAAAAPAQAEPPAVLILNAYHQGEDWSDNELAGILPALRAGHPDLVPAVEHLDTKRFPGPAHLDLLRRHLAEKYRDRQPDLLMVLDNPALDLLLKHRAELFPGVPVVFAGINGYTPAMIAGQENVTGVTEEQDMAGTLRLALRLRPGTRTILAIHDHTVSGLAVRRDMEEALEELGPELAGRVEVVFTPKGPFAELERTLAALPPDAVAVILSYVTDGAGRTFTRAESTRLISQASPVPVLCMHETRLGYGTLGGALLSGQEHGRRAAEMALRVLAGEPAGSIPVDARGGSRPIFDHAALARFGISEGDLPPGSLVVNRPVSFYGQNRLLVNAALAVATLLLLLIVLLGAALLRGRRAEAALRQSELRFRTLVENIPGAVYRCALMPPWPVQHMSEGILDISGRRAEEFMSKRVAYADFIHPEDLAMVERAVAEAVAGDEIFDIKYRLLHADGGLRWVHERGRAIYDQAGQPQHLDGTILDITTSRRAEEELRLSERRYRQLFNSVSDLIYTQDMEGRFTGFNPAVSRIMGYEPEEMLGRPASDFMKPDFAQAFRSEYLGTIAREGRAEGVSLYFHKNGERRFLEYRSQAVRPEGGQPFISGIARDVTERVLAEGRLKQLEEQLRQSQKMEAVGTLAGGIAHDFNNILGAVLGFAELALDSAEAGQGNAEELRQIILAAERARRLVSRLLTFSRKIEPQARTVDLNQEIAHALEMLSRTIPKMVALERELSPGLWPVKADPTQMEQVVINLGTNAVDAMPEGGRLTFATANLALSPGGSPHHHQIPPGDYVWLKVSDTGQGMDSRVQEQIFDPFFTTKEVGKGTGLGLAMVYGIVKEHGGHVFCDSHPGRGSTFSIYLPAFMGDDAPADPPPPSPPPGGGGETILLVDDEGMLRSLGERILGAAGYAVRLAGNGEEALAALGDPAGGIDLVVLDLGMPGMGGLKCLEAILARDPSAKVVIASGYAADGPVRQALQTGAAGFVAKPFGRAELLAAVRKALDTRRTA